MRKLFFIIVTVIGMMQIPMQSINAQNKYLKTSAHFREEKRIQDSNNISRVDLGWHR